MRFVSLLSLFLLLSTTVTACSVNKHQLWKCLVKTGDLDKNQQLDSEEIRSLVRKNTHWYERLIKSPDSVVRQMEQHCGIPLTYGKLLESGCFRHCGGLDGKRTVFNRVCHK